MVENFSEKLACMSLIDAFMLLEKRVYGYNDYINCDEDHFQQTFDGLETLVKRVQQEAVFSKNETLKEIDTDHMKLLLVPCFEADVLYRMMTEDRLEKVKQAHVFYLEFLKLMKHYNLLEEAQEKKFKKYKERYQEGLRQQEETKDQPQHPMQMLMGGMEDRETKIAQYKLKKSLEQNLERLKTHEDESQKREYYKTQIQLTIISALDQISTTDMEIGVLKHQASLSKEERAKNEALSSKDAVRKPLTAEYIGPDDVNKIPSLFPQMAVQLPQQHAAQAECPHMREARLEAERAMAEHEAMYGDPAKGLRKQVERIEVNNDDVNDRMNLKNQFQQQVFQPFFELPSVTLEEFADMEVEDALERQAKQEEAEAMKAERDESDEEVLEEQRNKDLRMDEWKDWNPKGKGITHRI